MVFCLHKKYHFVAEVQSQISSKDASLYVNCRLAPSLFRQSKKIGKGKIIVSGRLITDDEIDLGQVYVN